jgi:hypothetical protein
MIPVRTPKYFLTGIVSVMLLSSCAVKQDGNSKAATQIADKTTVGSLNSAEWEYRVTTYASMPIPWRHRSARDSIIVQIYNLDKSAATKPMLAQIQQDMRWNYRSRPIKATTGDIAFKNAILRVHGTLYPNAQFVETALY